MADFEILNPPKPPYWRDPRHQRAKGVQRYGVVTLSGILGVLALLPTGRGYGEAISYQLNRGEAVAWILIICTIMLLLLSAWLFLKHDHHFSSLLCGLSSLALAVIAVTDAHSALHNMCFFGLIVFQLIWTIALWYEYEDWIFWIAFVGTLAGAITCFFAWGLGERLLIGLTLAMVNRLYYNWLLY